MDKVNGDITNHVAVLPREKSPYPSTKVHSDGSMKRYFSAELTTSHADTLLLVCCIISGLVDSTIYNAYGTFVSMQTVLSLCCSLTVL